MLKNGELKVIIGYARVSTDGQTLDAQQSALTAAGAERVFAEKVSGAVTDRRQLTKAIGALGAGDILIVTKLDRLARSTRDLLNTLDAIGKAGATFRSLGDSWADTTTAHGHLMLTVLGGLAEFERHPCAHQRGALARQSARGEVWKEAQNDPTSTPRGARAAQPGRGTGRDRKDLRGQSFDDQSA
jgi:DNA invertase Pin-like site-specific DNA recombinase